MATCSANYVDPAPRMTRVALHSPDRVRGWLPWIWLTPILMILFNAVPGKPLMRSRAGL